MNIQIILLTFNNIGIYNNIILIVLNYSVVVLYDFKNY